MMLGAFRFDIRTLSPSSENPVLFCVNVGDVLHRQEGHYQSFVVVQWGKVFVFGEQLFVIITLRRLSNARDALVLASSVA